ncbi:hypothetical protein GALMADRAFT_147682 [Galerina marginata CBS 339.88]|uniref:Helicase C-terminal domain-containing protein n=1 Tax=Galerina marginata (strain CBS 339.88) TaxID=685588 RepID=A0A067S757_GALM3|nr:hypothetical protein GALMADRAFT_147682 [Galerina marginata CBS 339.88]
MVLLHHNELNGILADEVVCFSFCLFPAFSKDDLPNPRIQGLGKALQIVSFLASDFPGPLLVVVRKSTLQSCGHEFGQWTPDVNVVILTVTGTKEERANIIATRLIPQDFEVCMISYAICIIELLALKIVRAFSSWGRLLITLTPLQLFSLLNFIYPEIFVDDADLDSFKHKDSEDEVAVEEEKSKRSTILTAWVKADVEKGLLPNKKISIYVGLTEMQRKLYRSVLEKMSTLLMLREVTCRPYLFGGAEPGTPYIADEHLIQNSGRMLILDKLLLSMKEKGSRALIFSQMSRVFGILEDYCLFRQYKLCLNDSSTSHEDHIAVIDDYNKPGSEKFILLTTRAGGLGFNLTTTDVVVLYDRDCKYDGLNVVGLNNFKSDASVQQWEGEDFPAGYILLFFLVSALSNITVSTLRAGLQKVDKATEVPGHRNRSSLLYSQDFQFFPDKLPVLQDCEPAAHKRFNDIPAVARKPVTEEDMPDILEQEWITAQEFSVQAEPLDDDDLEQKEEYIKGGFPDWSRRDFQQLVRVLETYERGADAITLVAKIQDRSRRKPYVTMFTGLPRGHGKSGADLVQAIWTATVILSPSAIGKVKSPTISQADGVVLTSTDETLATPKPVELVNLFNRSPKVGLNFNRIFELEEGDSGEKPSVPHLDDSDYKILDIPPLQFAPEYDFADKENLPGPFLKRVDKQDARKAAASASTSASTTTTLALGSPSFSSNRVRRRGSSGLPLRTVAAANSAGRRSRSISTMPNFASDADYMPPSLSESLSECIPTDPTEIAQLSRGEEGTPATLINFFLPFALALIGFRGSV